MNIIDIIFPHYCCHCKKLGRILCSDCFEQLDFALPPSSPKLEPCFLDEIISCLEFTGPARSLMYDMKYYPIKDATTVCGKLLYYYTNFPFADCVSHVPLHPKRLRERGYNQSLLMAQTFRTLSGIPHFSLLKRSRFIKPQAQVSNWAQRQKNVLEQFQLKNNLRILAPQSVLLIDDVYTTGATLNDCARALKKWGVKKVIGLTVAHGQ